MYNNYGRPPQFGQDDRREGETGYAYTRGQIHQQGPAQSGQSGWEYTNGAWRPTGQGAPNPSYGTQGAAYGAPANVPRPRRKGGALKVASLVLACGLMGVGGGVLGAQVAQGNGQTVVYKAPENTVAAAGQLAAGDYSVSAVANLVKDSVVSITTENVVADFALGGRIVSGAGSGVILSEDGYIITNNHVVAGASNVKVTLPDESQHEATVVGTDPATDVAVIKIEVSGLSPVVLGDSDGLSVGEFCLAVGNPMGTLGGTVTDGIVSALDRQITIDGYTMNLLQMNAAVSPGNSGGGLFNAQGQLIGVVNAKSGGDGAEGLGFAIPVNTAMQVAQQLIENGYVTGRPALGVHIQNVVNQQQANVQGLPGPGVYIRQVNPGSAAEKAGLQAGDRVLAVDDKLVESSADLGQAIAAKAVGDEIAITVQRGNQELTLTAVLEEAQRAT